MTLAEAAAVLNAIPADKVNNNCVQDQKWRVRDALELANRFYKENDPAPNYVVEAVNSLKSWF